MSSRDLSKMTVVQLREQLRSRGLITDGTKAVLIERLKGSYAVEDKILNIDSTASKDSLEETVLEGSINEDDILGPDTSVKKKENILPVVVPSATKPASPVVFVAKESKVAQRPEGSKKSKMADNSLDAKMKRAQRFGLPLSDEQLKQKRAERFGTRPNEAASAALSLEERKKKRAERFGIDNKKDTGDVDESKKVSVEVLERRAKRFGLCSEEAEEQCTIVKF
ncbi:unnamed protein product [Thelazia callipaeda]|uniref:SAP domain-containing protein n=1 Tax=Thelazia callipaeda TaxID=103827 RepID=A0A158RCU2_THECL|nr:unnamed protein product [Thelazia callipaeda]